MMAIKHLLDFGTGKYRGTTGTYINEEGDEVFPEIAPGLVEVASAPPGPAEFFTWDGVSQWIEDSNRADTEADREIAATFEASKIQRLLFDMNFDQETRLRVLEGRSVITKVQYRDALLTRLKTL